MKEDKGMDTEMFQGHDHYKDVSLWLLLEGSFNWGFVQDKLVDLFLDVIEWDPNNQVSFQRKLMRLEG